MGAITIRHDPKAVPAPRHDVADAPDLPDIPWLDRDGWQSESEACARYSAGLAWPVVAGHSVHVGGGLWVSACAACPEAVKHWGMVPRWATIGPHEVAEHGAQVGGINVGMLP